MLDHKPVAFTTLRSRGNAIACLSALNALDPESYSIAKDRRRALPRSDSRLYRAVHPRGVPDFRRGRSVAPIARNLVELIGFEPTTSGLQSPRSPS